MTSIRAGEIAANLELVNDRIAAACHAAGRDPASVTLVAVTKTWPASDAEILAGLGITHFAENRDQEARSKARDMTSTGITWHFIGQVQRNKAASVASYADLVESVDRAALIEALERGAGRADRRLGVCIQVDLGNVTSDRGGADPADLEALAQAIVDTVNLDLAGLMAVAPRGVDPGSAFAVLAGLHARLLGSFPAATMLSAGMSSDLEAAIEHGATHVRLGSALLGHRQPFK